MTLPSVLLLVPSGSELGAGRDARILTNAVVREAGSTPPAACEVVGIFTRRAIQPRNGTRWRRSGATPGVCDDRLVSRRDLVHVLTALWRLSSANPDVGVPVAQIDEAIGRGHGDMRTPLNLQSLSDEGLALRLPEGTWALTPPGFAWLKQDRELSDR